MWGDLSDERTNLPFVIAAGSRQRSHSWVRVPWDSWPYFTVSNSRLPEPGGPSPRIYIPQEQGDPVIPPDTGLPSRRLLRLTGLQWRYSNPPPPLNRSRNRSLLPATSRHSHTWHRAPLGPMAIYLFNFRPFLFLSLILLIDKGGVGLLYIYIYIEWCLLTTP
jgi:hypothetical protein